MPNRERGVDHGAIAGRRLQLELGHELREARLGRGLRQRDVARVSGSSASRISRIELGQIRGATVADFARLGAAVGLRLHARFYPDGGGLRDTAQLALLRRLRARIGDRWSWQLEAPLPIPGDRRAFDALLSNREATIAIEAITRLGDAQAQLRAAALKQRDGAVPRIVIAISATRHNRAALASAAEVLATTFPTSPRATLAALSKGKDPGDNGIVLL